MRVFDGEELVGDMPVRALVDDCPLYDLAPVKPATPIYAPPEARLAQDVSLREVLLALLASPNIASRRPLFEQYDSIVQSRTVRRPEQADAAVLALDRGPHPAGEDRPIPGLAVSIDCNGSTGRCRSVPRHDRGGSRVRVQSRLCRRRAAWHD